MKKIIFTSAAVTSLAAGLFCYTNVSKEEILHASGKMTEENKKTVYEVETKLSKNPPTNVKASYKKAEPEKVILDAPIINQLPELPRGCEVTSLTMLLQYAGVKVDKETLGKEIKRDPTPRTVKNGVTHFGNPNDGFVGDMYAFDTAGYGVYHGPIAELAEKYLPHRIVDFSGEDFEKIFLFIDAGTPVWVINNAMFDEISSEYFKTWETPSGPISITMKEHSVLITGYDKEYVYFNDPLSGVKNEKAPIEQFKKGWEQMGKQAVSYSIQD
ncbi:C39 family peptidase [Bacillus thuringiensis]|uniref:Peptidase C39 n=1 Tax=Bacillus thuringiensis TaxID=1428 RepID=A0A9X6WGR5_BACTU|nr:C39 family peptidase [Bacillus thuringiensis]PFJ29080.1 peptidase C39 [Bacillus thuringiensis]